MALDVWRHCSDKLIQEFGESPEPVFRRSSWRSRKRTVKLVCLNSARTTAVGFLLNDEAVLLGLSSPPISNSSRHQFHHRRAATVHGQVELSRLGPELDRPDPPAAIGEQALGLAH